MLLKMRVVSPNGLFLLKILLKINFFLFAMLDEYRLDIPRKQNTVVLPFFSMSKTLLRFRGLGINFKGDARQVAYFEVLHAVI
jgi:hypothetical protein